MHGRFLCPPSSKPDSRLPASPPSPRGAQGQQRQTLTGLGKWWGRKPLILVRASILGILRPASPDARKDRTIFLKMMILWRIQQNR
ncbi:MAG: DUF1156 domain-containing protein [Chromatiaceae bacterium]|nr:DUF1156 domain-containing protein [Chromatiaceae bacterium]MBP9605188.1 DUF1156 domain-containing protein [Chromatiaceae bacterium]